MTRITRPGPEDSAAISALSEAAFRETFAHLYPPKDLAAFLTEWNPPTKVAAHLADLDYALAVAHDDRGELAGYIKLGPVDFDALPAVDIPHPRIELHHLYLRESAKGTGAAAALMEWALAEARARGAATMLLSVFVDNHRAQAFYRRYGFAEIGKNAFRVGTVIDDDRIWCLRL